MADAARIVFMGTPDFARVSLEALVARGMHVAAVVTQPDRPHGRGNRVLTSPVKDLAVDRGIPVLQPEKLEEILPQIRELAPDFIAVVAFGQLLSSDALCVPCRVCAGGRHACINVHASLLPAYRGAGPIQAALLNGDTATGVSTMLMEQGMDTGPILLQKQIPIAPDDNFHSLHDALAAAGADLLVETMENFEDITPQPQDHSRATYTEKITREHGAVDWSLPAEQIHNRVRAYTPWPSAYTFHGRVRIRLWKTQPQPQAPADAAPGTVLEADNEGGLVVACGRGALRILELQREGKKRQPADTFLLGFPMSPGDRLGPKNTAA